jgi:hypothetical protein
MSLVNDALRRARDAQQQAPPPPPSQMQFRPIDTTSHARHNLALLIPAALAVVALLVLFFVWQWAQEHRRSGLQEARAFTPPASQMAITPQSASASMPETATAQAAVAEPVLSPQPDSSTTPVAASANSPAAPSIATLAYPPIAEQPQTNSTNLLAMSPLAPPKTPPLRLQAIVFDPKRPSALINGKTVFVGDKLGDSRVVAIDRESATIVGSGKTTVLTLEE